MLNSLPKFRSLLRDESGNVQSTEYILMIVLLAIGGIVGLATLRDQVAQELADTGVALRQLDQSFDIDTAVYSASYDDSMVGPVPPTDPENTGPGTGGPAGMTFTAVMAGTGEAGGTSDGDSNN